MISFTHVRWLSFFENQPIYRVLEPIWNLFSERKICCFVEIYFPKEKYVVFYRVRIINVGMIGHANFKDARAECQTWKRLWASRGGGVWRACTPRKFWNLKIFHKAFFQATHRPIATSSKRFQKLNVIFFLTLTKRAFSSPVIYFHNFKIIIVTPHLMLTNTIY